MRDIDNEFINKTATVSGWGKIKDTVNQITDKLRKANLVIMSNKGCNVYFFGAVQECHICGKGLEDESACNGDSGGPLTIKDGNGDVLVMILLNK